VDRLTADGPGRIIRAWAGATLAACPVNRLNADGTRLGQPRGAGHGGRVSGGSPAADGFRPDQPRVGAGHGGCASAWPLGGRRLGCREKGPRWLRVRWTA